jgi:hypothetical protein
MTDFVVHHGACHCGRVRFEVEAPADVELLDCNCSICAMTGILHLIVPRDRFRLTHGAEELTDYRFGTGVAQHTFCRHCGIKGFYVPRSHPDQVSVNIRCIDPSTVRSRHVIPFDGLNWEQARADLG